MGKGTKQQGFANSGTAQNLSNNLTSNASSIYGSLEPTLQAEMAHPSGFTPQAKAAMNTAAQQSAGGSTAAATGAGRLFAARTRNAGGAKAAIGEGVRNAGENLSNAAVNTEVQNAKLQEAQRQGAISGLEGLNATELTGGENALGLSNQALGVTNQAQPSFWQQAAGDAMGNLLGSGDKYLNKTLKI